MHTHDYLQLALYFGLLLVCTPLLGAFMANVFQGKKTWLSPIFAPAERLIYKVSRIDSSAEMPWKQYAASLMAFNMLGFLTVFGLMLTQTALPLNPQGINGTSVYLAFNTAVSFMTNTNWQAYSGEAALSYATQMLGLGVQNFVSAATGIAVIVALARGIARKQAASLGNFWVDLTRSTLYILLPLSFLLAIVLISQGVVQTFSAYIPVSTLEGREQVIPLGPAASQIAIKQS